MLLIDGFNEITLVHPNGSNHATLLFCYLSITYNKAHYNINTHRARYCVKCAYIPAKITQLVISTAWRAIHCAWQHHLPVSSTHSIYTISIVPAPACDDMVECLSPPNEGAHRKSSIKKKPKQLNCLGLSFGGEGGIRTLDTLPYTHFPGVLLQPLGHLTKFCQRNVCWLCKARVARFSYRPCRPAATWTPCSIRCSALCAGTGRTLGKSPRGVNRFMGKLVCSRN